MQERRLYNPSTQQHQRYTVTAKILGEICKDVVEPVLLPLTGEKMQKKSEKIGDEVRLDVRAFGFWVRGQQAFIYVRVFDPNACRYLETSLQQCYTMNEKEKKRQHNERIMETDHGTTGLDFRPIYW